MKKLLIVITSVLVSHFTLAQEWVQASIGNGANPTSVDIFIRSNTTFDANKVDNIVFTLRIPIMGGNNIIATEVLASHSPAFPHITFTIVKYAVNDGVYNYYLVNGIGTVVAAPGINIPGDETPHRVMEISFSGGSNGIVELANIENDIPGNNGALIRPQFYVQNNSGEITNLTAMYYGTAGAIPQNNANTDGDDWVPTVGNVTLPVQLTNYDVKCNDKGALIKWSTATEQNSDRFEIQRSTNGNDWVTVDNVAAAGNSSSDKNYQYLDIYGGTAFYRIRQVDVDGRFTYTAIKTTNCKAGQFDVTLYPVPAKDKLNIVVQSDKELKTDLQVLDMTGKIVQRTIIQINKGNNNIVLDINNLPGGQYLLVSSDPAVLINKKFTIVR